MSKSRETIARKAVLRSICALSLALLWAMEIGKTNSVAQAQGPDGHSIYYVGPDGNCGEMAPCFSTVQAAVDAVDAPDDVVKVAAGTYTGVSSRSGTVQLVYVYKSLTLQGGYSTTSWTTPYPLTQTTILDAQGQGRVIFITGTVTFAGDGLQITNGKAPDGSNGNGGAGGHGGGIYIDADPIATLSQVHVVGNAAGGGGNGTNTMGGNGGGGGGIYSHGILTLTNSSIIQNSTGRGGTGEGGYADGAPGNGGGVYLHYSRAVLNGNTVVSNTSGNYSGGIHLYHGEATLSNNTIISNTAVRGGGISLLSMGSGTTLHGNTITANKASLRGGGLHLEEGFPVLNGNTVSSNTSWCGGGLSLNGSSAILTANTIVTNTAKADGITGCGGGGGVYGYASTATLMGNDIARNDAVYDGGGILLESTTDTIVGNTIVSNTGPSAGVVVWGGKAKLSRNTIVRNPGGMDMWYQAAPVLTNNIIADNGRGVSINSSSPSLVHNTIANNGGIGIAVSAHVFWGGSNVLITNTVLVSQTVGIAVYNHTLYGLYSYSTARLDGTLWGNGTEWTGDGTIITGTHNYWGNPAFVNPAGRDFHIGVSSAAIDRGVNAGTATDIDNQPRPNPDTSIPDLGADESWACVAITNVGIAGPATGTINSPVTFAGIVTPSTATPYMQYTWSPEPGIGQGTTTVTYTFASFGLQTIRLTVENCGGSRAATHTLQIPLPIPGIPNLFSPADDMITTTQWITFVWQAGLGAIPLGYNVQVDSGSIITTTSTISATLLAEGFHTWTVRAFNAEGYSAWAAAWSVEVRRFHIYLPITVRNS
jgi:parallel beta-helix repeat protein